MVLQHSRFVLALISILTVLLTISSVKVLSGFIAAQHTAGSASKGAASGEWGRFVGQTEANIENHTPHLLQRDEVSPSKGLQAAHAAFARKDLLSSPYMQMLQTTSICAFIYSRWQIQMHSYGNSALVSDLWF